jgi:hypothetical protein
LGRNESIILIRTWNYLDGVLEGTIECVCDGDWEGGSKKIYVQLQIASRVEPVHREQTTASVRGTDEIE